MQRSTYHQKIARVFLDKPEMVIDLPEWMLNGDQVAAYRKLKRPAIVEIAGRDSVAAAVKSVDELNFTDLLPVYAYSGTEYGAWRSVEQAVERLSARLPEVMVHPMMVVGSPAFWRAINGRHVSECISRFNFFSPCPGCHLYLHLIRVPLSEKLGNMPIISGERELHSGQEKINQTGDVLDYYLEAAGRFDIELLFPLRYIKEDREIQHILQMPWERDKDQLECTFSGNYRLRDGSVGASTNDVNRFFEVFALPAATQMINAYLNGNIPDFTGITRHVLDAASF